jgi:putrescine importer
MLLSNTKLFSKRPPELSIDKAIEKEIQA